MKLTRKTALWSGNEVQEGKRNNGKEGLVHNTVYSVAVRWRFSDGEGRDLFKVFRTLMNKQEVWAQVAC